MRNRTQIRRMTFSALFLAIAMVLPFITGQIPQIGAMLSPMHIPVLLCGFVCGPLWGLAVGFIAPLLRSVLFGMPGLYPTAICMAFELATYGCAAGLLYRVLPKGNVFVYMALVLSMLIGRVVWGVAEYIVLGLGGQTFTFRLFLEGAFINAVPGIIFHIVLIPPIILVLQKAGLMENG
ncbi:MAG: ECF transporter S component [Clostridia bacterium]|nr:ECF transporter S component [Clostridia bacterium]